MGEVKWTKGFWKDRFDMVMPNLIPVSYTHLEYQRIIRRAYQAMFEQSERFRAALMQTRGIKLVHTSGEPSSYKTVSYTHLHRFSRCQCTLHKCENYQC